MIPYLQASSDAMCQFEDTTSEEEDSGSDLAFGVLPKLLVASISSEQDRVRREQLCEQVQFKIETLQPSRIQTLAKNLRGFV